MNVDGNVGLGIGKSAVAGVGWGYGDNVDSDVGYEVGEGFEL